MSNILIRLATEDDADQVQAIYAPFCGNTPVSFETTAPTIEEMRQRIAKTLAIVPWLIADRDGQVLGYAYAARHRERAAYVWSVDASVYVRGDCRRLGLGRALYTSLFALLKLQGFYTVLAGITVPNPGSVGLHEAMGFEPVGTYRGIGYKCRAWHDVLWLQRALRDRSETEEPDAPLNLLGVRSSPDWNEALASGLSWIKIEPAD
jgi:phosphinothricin acetyltransferase